VGSLLVGAMDGGHLDPMVERTRALLADRMAAVLHAFAMYAPDGCSLSVPAGGMCTWLQLPDHLDAHSVLVAARHRGVSFKPGDLFSPSSDHRNCGRVVVAHYDSETLVRGIEILCDVVREQLVLSPPPLPSGCGALSSRDGTAA